MVVQNIFTGQRSCMGEHLTRAEMFLTVATLIQQFTLSLAEGDPVQSTKPEDMDGIFKSPPSFKLHVSSRM